MKVLLVLEILYQHVSQLMPILSFFPYSEKKFRDLGEFVEGKTNMDIALERTLEDDEEEEILKTEEENDGTKRGKQKMCSVSSLILMIWRSRRRLMS